MSLLARKYPEMVAGGYPASHPRINFFTRIRTLLPENAHVLDFGAGRGRLAAFDTPQMRVHTDLKRSVARLAVFDVDEAVMENAESEDRHHRPLGERLPFEDDSFDLVYCTWVAEHISDTEFYCGEIRRILKPGGWFCALTPNKWGIIAFGGRLVPNSLHVAVLKVLSPQRQENDVFPTAYKLNTRSDIQRCFPGWRNGSYLDNGPVSYHANSSILFGFWQIVDRVMPRGMSKLLYVFVQKPEQ